MSKKEDRFVSEWKPFSELKRIPDDISELGYRREYIDEHKLEETKVFHWGSAEGAVCFYEPIEVKKEGDDILWRVNENHVHMDVPEEFETQFGVFINHNNGEFTSWLEKDNYHGLSTEEKMMKKAFGMGDYMVDGNYCDMFDCGEYCYAISNLMHLGLGEFKIIRIDKNLEIETMYDNHSNWFERLEYLGRFQKDGNHMIIASGCREAEKNRKENTEQQDITLLFCIDEHGNCSIQREWNIIISEANSIAAFGDHVYFGQNKMVTRLNFETGDVEYYTDKSDEELAVLINVW